MAKQKIRIRVIAWVALTAAVGVVAYLVGHSGGSSTITVTGPGIADLGQSGGTAYVGAGERLNRQPYGFAYSIPTDVSWSDASGSLHDGGRPSCMPVGKAEHIKNIEAVQFTIPDGTTTGTVLWIQC
jgi:hypothetical protein